MSEMLSLTSRDEIQSISIHEHISSNGEHCPSNGLDNGDVSPKICPVVTKKTNVQISHTKGSVFQLARSQDLPHVCRQVRHALPPEADQLAKALNGTVAEGRWVSQKCSPAVPNESVAGNVCSFPQLIYLVG